MLELGKVCVVFKRVLYNVGQGHANVYVTPSKYLLAFLVSRGLQHVFTLIHVLCLCMYNVYVCLYCIYIYVFKVYTLVCVYTVQCTNVCVCVLYIKYVRCIQCNMCGYVTKLRAYVVLSVRPVNVLTIYLCIYA